MSYSVPAVETAIRLLNYLKANSGERMSLAEACEALEIPRSTGFNILKTLKKHRLVDFEPQSKRYSLGWALVGLGASVLENSNVINTAKPYLRDLANMTRLTVVLAERSEDDLVMLHKIEQAANIRVTATVGDRYPLSAGGIGKSLMACLSSDEIVGYVERRGLPLFTENATTSVNVFLQNLEKVREKGYSTSFEEYIRGVNVVAAPVLDSWGRPTMAVAVLGLVSDLPRERVDELAPVVMHTAHELSIALGGTARKAPALSTAAN